MKKIAIVGAGYSGTLVAVNLLQLSREGGLHIQLIDKIPRMGRGLAYRTWDDNHLLNVPAGNMSALAHEPNHFVDFCRTEDPALGPASFVSRRLYGDYLETILDDAVRNSRATLERVPFEAAAVRQDSATGNPRVEFSGRPPEQCDRVVLAFGHLLPLHPAPDSTLYDSDAFVANPWSASAFDAISTQQQVMIIGTGHTAIDVLFRLTNHTDERKIYMVSRRGLLPQTHRPQTKQQAASRFPEYLDACQANARAYCRAIRQEVLRGAEQGLDWRDVIGQLRAHTPEIWHRLSVAERKRFLKHLVPYWDIHRHRLAPAAYGRFSRLVESGQVEVLAGRIRGYEREDGRVRITLTPRRQDGTRSLTVDKVINCSGPNYDLARCEAPLIRQLLSEGYLRQDPLKIGLEVTPHYQTVNAAGAASDKVFYVGPMLKARDWEAIAVPELRVHTRKLAEILLEQSATGVSSTPSG